MAQKLVNRWTRMVENQHDDSDSSSYENKKFESSKVDNNKKTYVKDEENHFDNNEKLSKSYTTVNKNRNQDAHLDSSYDSEDEVEEEDFQSNSENEYASNNKYSKSSEPVRKNTNYLEDNHNTTKNRKVNYFGESTDESDFSHSNDEDEEEKPERRFDRSPDNEVLTKNRVTKPVKYDSNEYSQPMRSEKFSETRSEKVFNPKSEIPYEKYAKSSTGESHRSEKISTTESHRSEKPAKTYTSESLRTEKPAKTLTTESLRIEKPVSKIVKTESTRIDKPMKPKSRKSDMSQAASFENFLMDSATQHQSESQSTKRKSTALNGDSIVPKKPKVAPTTRTDKESSPNDLPALPKFSLNDTRVTYNHLRPRPEIPASSTDDIDCTTKYLSERKVWVPTRRQPPQDTGVVSEPEDVRLINGVPETVIAQYDYEKLLAFDGDNRVSVLPVVIDIVD